MAVPYFQFITQTVTATAADVVAIKAKQIAQDAKLDAILANQAALASTFSAIAQAITDTQQIALQTREQFFMSEGQ